MPCRRRLVLLTPLLAAVPAGAAFALPARDPFPGPADPGRRALPAQSAPEAPPPRPPSPPPPPPRCAPPSPPTS